jgi:putative transposase
LFGDSRWKAIQRYREFIRDGMEMGKREDLVGGGLLRSAGGWEGVRALKRSGECWLGDERILGDGIFVEEVLKDADEIYERKQQLRKEGWDIEILPLSRPKLTEIKV